MARLAQNSLKGLALALRAMHFNRVVRFHNNLLKKTAALKASKLKDGHIERSQNARFHDNNTNEFSFDI
jgi:3-phosphoglycerate kinase